MSEEQKTPEIPPKELTEEQKQKLKDFWNSSPKDKPPTLMALVNHIFPGEDARSRSGILVKKFLASTGIKAQSSHEWKSKTIELELTPAQQEFIRNHIENMSVMDIMRELFPSAKVSNLSTEYRRIYRFIQTLPNAAQLLRNEIEEYNSPKNLTQILSRLTKYKIGNINPEKLSAGQKKCFQSLVGFLSNYRFLHQINSYLSTQDRELFESTFIRYTYDKMDFTEEEIDRYILLCTDAVIAANILKTIDMMQREQDLAIQETGKLSMSLVEAIGIARKEYNECVKRQENLYKTLVTNRNERIDQQMGENSSILNFIALWKDEVERKKWLLHAQKYQSEAGKVIQE
ncbi:MAG: hypothetical protein AABY22_15995, partial [Nanoarchaeota archaeon]